MMALPAVLLRYLENIEISTRYRYIVSYRIVGENIEIFVILVSIFLCVIVLNIHLFILASI